MQPTAAQACRRPSVSVSAPGDEPAQRGTDAPSFAQLVEGASDVRVDMARLSSLMGCLDGRLQARKRRAEEEVAAGAAKLRGGLGTGGGRAAKARRRAEGLIRGVREAAAEVDKLSAEKIDISRQLYDSLDRFICELDRRFTLLKNNKDVVPAPVPEPQAQHSAHHSTKGTSNGHTSFDSPSSESGVPGASGSSGQRQALHVEPTYCICGRGYFGLMVCCDSPTCKIGWYHASCLGFKDSEVKELPSKWKCPACEEANKFDVKNSSDS